MAATSGFGSFKQLIMPALALGMQSTAVVARMTRSSSAGGDTPGFRQDSQGKGQKESVVIMKHVFRNALILLSPWWDFSSERF